MMRIAGATVGATLVAAVLGACSSSTRASSGAPATTTAVVSTQRPAPVPPPKGRTVLTVRGSLSNRNRGSSLEFDQATLDAMANRQATIFEPFVKRDIRFTGIPISVLLGRAGISPSATKVAMHALDDYRVQFKVADLMAPGVLLATKADGAAIPVAKGGPIRLVFRPQSAAGKNKDVWIWSIDSMMIS